MTQRADHGAAPAGRAERRPQRLRVAVGQRPRSVVHPAGRHRGAVDHRAAPAGSLDSTQECDVLDDLAAYGGVAAGSVVRRRAGRRSAGRWRPRATDAARSRPAAAAGRSARSTAAVAGPGVPARRLGLLPRVGRHQVRDRPASRLSQRVRTTRETTSASRNTSTSPVAASASCWQAYGLPSQPCGGSPLPDDEPQPRLVLQGLLRALGCRPVSRRRGPAPRGRHPTLSREPLTGRRSRAASSSRTGSSTETLGRSRPEPASGAVGAVECSPRRGGTARSPQRPPASWALHRSRTISGSATRPMPMPPTIATPGRSKKTSVGEHAGHVRPEVERERLLVGAGPGDDAVDDSHQDDRHAQPAEVVGERDPMNTRQSRRGVGPVPMSGRDHLRVEEQVPAGERPAADEGPGAVRR